MSAARPAEGRTRRIVVGASGAIAAAAVRSGLAVLRSVGGRARMVAVVLVAVLSQIARTG